MLSTLSHEQSDHPPKEETKHDRMTLGLYARTTVLYVNIRLTIVFSGTGMTLRTIITQTIAGRIDAWTGDSEHLQVHPHKKRRVTGP
jgi:hypothetical protein